VKCRLCWRPLSFRSPTVSQLPLNSAAR
jgi:hypothetical protein